MRRTVKSVAANSKTRIILIRNRVKISVRWNRLVKCRIEDSDLRHIGASLQSYLDAQQIGGIVQGRQRRLFTDARDDRFA